MLRKSKGDSNANLILFTCVRESGGGGGGVAVLSDSLNHYRQKTLYKKIFTHVESHASAVSLLEGGE